MIADQDGMRLYLTFTRFRYRSDAPLAQFRENDLLGFDAARTGALGMCVSKSPPPASGVRVVWTDAGRGWVKRVAR